MPHYKKSAPHRIAQISSAESHLAAHRLWAAAGIATIVYVAIIAYYPSLSGGFILDDDTYLTNNPIIQSADGLYRFWCTTEPLDYYPVTNTTLWLEWRLWESNPTGYHVTHLVLHIVESLLLWVILRKLAIPGAFLAAIIFTVHPVNVEAVAWLSQRKDMLAMLFFLLSILCYLKFDIPTKTVHHPVSQSACAGHSLSQPVDTGRSPAERRPLFYCLSLLAFVLSMLSKSSVVVLPVLLFGILWWRGEMTRKNVAAIMPFFLVTVILAVVNTYFKSYAFGEEIRSPSYVLRLLEAGSAVWFYLYKAVLPIQLAFIYAPWRAEAGNVFWWLPLTSVVIVTIVLWHQRQGWGRPFLFAWGFFCVSLGPMLGFIEVGFMQYSLVADHYQHIAMMGVIALAAAGWSKWHAAARGSARLAARAVAVAVVSILMLLTYLQSELYRDPIALYQDTLEKNPDSWIAHCNLGNALYQANCPREAIPFLEQTLRLNPKYADAHNNLGNALSQTGRPEEAITHYEQALRLKPNFPEAHTDLGNALLQIGRIQEAIDQYVQALRQNPNLPVTCFNLGNAFSQAGRNEEAMESYRQALRLKPDFPQAIYNLANILRQIDRPLEAIQQYCQVLRLQPDMAEAYYNMALAYAETNQIEKSLVSSQMALQLARSKGQTALAKQIDDWLKSYRAGLSE